MNALKKIFVKYRNNNMKKLILLYVTLFFVSCSHTPEEQKRLDEDQKEIDAAQKKYDDATKQIEASEQAKKPTDSLEFYKSLKDEPNLIRLYKAKWENITLKKDGKFPQYETYQTEMENLLTGISKATNNDSKLFPKLEKMKFKWIDSKKYQETLENYMIFGQPFGESDLTSPCKSYLEENLNDPSSLDIVDFAIEGQSKKGWIVWAKYRAKNGFGALVLQASKFIVQYSIGNKIFQVTQAITDN